MNFRLQQFLSAENITQAQLADMLGVARASVSHILAGRNKPGFDFIQSMSRSFPDLNLEWLINGKGRMYKDDRRESVQSPLSDEGPLFETPKEPEKPEYKPEYKEVKPIVPEVKVQAKDRKITRIVVFYDDNSYQELREV